MIPSSIPGVADVELLGGAAASGPPDLLVEVPHGADRRAHYEALRARLEGELPAGLEAFFFVNTDVGAWQLGRRVAERLVEADPRRSALVVRSLIPRTFIDCNRLEDAAEGELASGGLTAGIPAYVRDPRDRARLVELHRRYVALVEQAFAGGPAFALIPHTYGPVTLGIERVDDDIVENLRRAHAPGLVATWPRRPEVDLITRTADGTLLGSAEVARAVTAGYRALGIEVAENATYHMHPATMGYRFAAAYPGRTFTLEIRRDLLCRDWIWNLENEVDPMRIDRFAAPLATAVAAAIG
jgi:predicted N-formylglutamate amidohydrolase